MRNFFITDIFNAGEGYGGKAKGLSQLVRLGIPIPKGFAISSNMIDGLLLKKDKQAINEFLDFLNNLSKSKKIAVRSSASSEDGQGKSFAGIFKTMLNVNNELEEVLKAISYVRASAETEIVNAYDNKNQEMNIIIQEMVNPTISGVAFTEAIDLDGSKVFLIECVEGLADQLVSGKITPSRITFQINKEGKINQESLSFVGKILDIKALENLMPHFQTIIDGFETPMDLEWCVDEEYNPYVVQARPITSKVFIKKQSNEKGIIASPGISRGKTYVIDENLDDEEILKLIKNFPSDYILVAAATNTEYLPAIKKASGIITEEGSILSHAAIVAREMGKPCVVNYKDAMSLFPTGTKILLDATNGKIISEKVQFNIDIKKEMEFGELYCFDFIIPIEIEEQTVLYEPTINGLIVHLDEEVTSEFINRVEYYTRKVFKQSPTVVQSQKYLWYFEISKFKLLPYFNNIYNIAITLAQHKNCKETDLFYDSVVKTLSELVDFKNNKADDITQKFIEEICVSWHFIVDMVLPCGYGLREIYASTLSVLDETGQTFSDLLNGNIKVWDQEGLLNQSDQYLKCISKNRNDICEKLVAIGAMSYDYFDRREDEIKAILEKRNISCEDDVVEQFYTQIDKVPLKPINEIMIKNKFIVKSLNFDF